jgi:cold shock protein
MATGRVKWFSQSKGVGFIEPDDGSSDVFVNASALRSAGVPAVVETQKVEYDLVHGRNGERSVRKLKVI